jgi:Glycosyl hydrolase catalytic core
MAAGMEFVPMQWGRWGLAGLDHNLGLLSPRPAALLGFNEPTHIGQVQRTAGDHELRQGNQMLGLDRRHYATQMAPRE